MSDFKFSCSKCAQSIVCDASNAGMQIPCPGCGTLLTVPTPAPEAPTGPAKLSIHKSTAVHHAAPAASTTPAKPAWGSKAAPPPRAKKKFPISTVVTVVVLIAALAAGWVWFGAPYLKQRADAEKQKQEEAARQAAEQQRAEAEAAARLKASKAGWRLDLVNTPFPERHASGKIHAGDFNVETVIFQNGTLTLRQDSGVSCQFLVPIHLKPGETIAGKTIQVDSTDTTNQLHVVVNWKGEAGQPPGNEAFTKGYSLKLEFGSPADGKVPGKIYLCVPDPEQSYVAGDFEIGPRVNPNAAGGAPPPEATRRRRARPE